MTNFQKSSKRPKMVQTKGKVILNIDGLAPLISQGANSPIVYWLDLYPDWKIHPTFHVSHLKRYLQLDEFVQEVEPSPPMLVEGVKESRI